MSNKTCTKFSVDDEALKDLSAEQIRDAHNRWIDTLPEEFQIWKMGKTPYEAMVEGLEKGEP